MRRLLWMGIGAGLTVYVWRRVGRTLRRYTSGGIVEQAGRAGRDSVAAVRSARERFSVAFGERQRELVTRLLVEPDGGDASAVRRRHARGGPSTDAVASARPTGRVDESEPLYDF